MALKCLKHETYNGIIHCNLYEMQKSVNTNISSLDPHLILDFLTLSFKSGGL